MTQRSRPSLPGDTPAPIKKKRWQPPTLTPHGRIADIIRGGGGKLSINVDGDGRKPSGGG